MPRFVDPIRSRLNPVPHRVALSLVLLAGLVMTACYSDQDVDPPTNSSQSNRPAPKQVANKDGNDITASPNPIALGGMARKTTISWSTQGIPGLDVHVLIYDSAGTEQGLFATGSVGSQDATWISQPTEFRLVSGSGPDRKVLGSVVVTLEQ